jgi:hypothetical protein
MASAIERTLVFRGPNQRNGVVDLLDMLSVRCAVAMRWFEAGVSTDDYMEIRCTILQKHDTDFESLRPIVDTWCHERAMRVSTTMAES